LQESSLLQEVYEGRTLPVDSNRYVVDQRHMRPQTQNIGEQRVRSVRHHSNRGPRARPQVCQLQYNIMQYEYYL